MWQVPADTHTDPAVYFECSQATVEKVKQLIPVFHTRAMRSVMFQKFGRISPGIKPAVLRYFYKELTGQ